jgi:hypothetical protein
MTWLYVPNLTTPLPSAQEPGGSNSASSLPDPERAASLTWRGKHMRPEHWPRAWKRDSWLRRLSGLTLPPSTLDHGVAAFIASLPETPVSRTALPAEASALPTSASSWSAPYRSMPTAGLLVSSGKTSRGMRTGSSPLQYQHWKDWVAALRLEYSARPRAGGARCARGSSLWPTPVATEARQGFQGRYNAPGQQSLTTAALLWPRQRLAAFLLDQGIFRAGLRLLNDDLTSFLSDESLWPAPTASCVDIDTMERMGTPGYVRQAQKEAGSPYLARVSGVLNPAFVEWLMGWPIGWTDCASAVTGFTHWQQDMRGLLSTLCSRKPLQATLL